MGWPETGYKAGRPRDMNGFDGLTGRWEMGDRSDGIDWDYVKRQNERTANRQGTPIREAAKKKTAKTRRQGNITTRNREQASAWEANRGSRKERRQRHRDTRDKRRCLSERGSVGRGGYALSEGQHGKRRGKTWKRKTREALCNGPCRQWCRGRPVSSLPAVWQGRKGKDR